MAHRAADDEKAFDIYGNNRGRGDGAPLVRPAQLEHVGRLRRQRAQCRAVSRRQRLLWPSGSTAEAHGASRAGISRLQSRAGSAAAAGASAVPSWTAGAGIL